jgi:hypothetical protein
MRETIPTVTLAIELERDGVSDGKDQRTRGVRPD